LSTPVS